MTFLYGYINSQQISKKIFFKKYGVILQHNKIQIKITIVGKKKKTLHFGKSLCKYCTFGGFRASLWGQILVLVPKQRQVQFFLPL